MTQSNRNWVSFTLLCAVIGVLLWLVGKLQPLSPEELVRHASVRLATGEGCTMIHHDGTTAFGITAAHCVGKVGSEVGIVVNGATLTGKVLSKDRYWKLALIGVVSKEIEHFTPVSEQPRHATGFFTFNETGKLALQAEEGGFFPNDSDVIRRSDLGVIDRIVETVAGASTFRDSGIGVFQGNKLVGVITHVYSRGLFTSPTLPGLRGFVTNAMETFPAELIKARELPADQVSIAAVKTISTGSVPIQAIRVLDRESVLVVTSLVGASDAAKDKKARDDAKPSSAQLRFEWSKWNVATGRELLRITKEIPFPAVITMTSPDGSWVGVCSNSTNGKRKTTDFCVVTIWNTNSGREIATWKTKKVIPFLSRIVVSPSGKRLALVAVGSPPGEEGSSEFSFDELESSVQVWRVQEGRLEKTLLTQRGDVLTLGGFDRNGRHLSALIVESNETGKTNKKGNLAAIVWRMSDWKKVTENKLSGESAFPSVHQLESEVAVLDSGFFGTGQMELWNFRSGKKSRTLAFRERPNQPASESADGSYFAFMNRTGSDLFFSRSINEIAVLDMESGLIFARLRESKSVATAFSFTKDGRRIISGSNDGGIRIWNLPPSRQPKPTP